MALRVGRGFGSVELKWSYRPDGISHFKGYPKLTHLLKAGAAGAGQAGQPMGVKVVQDRISTLQSWKARIIGTAPEVGSGIWLEVTVQAATMQAAHEIAVASKYLDHLYLFSAAAGDQQLLTHTISKADMFTDLDALLAVAEQKQIFRGSHSKASTQLQRQAVIDLYNAMGWHPGRRPTALDSLTAWWDSSQATLDIVQELEQFHSAAGARTLFTHVQLHTQCQGCHRVGTYTLCGGANQFRIRCNQCRNTLGTQKFRSHIAQLAVHNQLGVDLQALVVDPSPRAVCVAKGVRKMRSCQIACAHLEKTRKLTRVKEQRIFQFGRAAHSSFWHLTPLRAFSFNFPCASQLEQCTICRSSAQLELRTLCRSSAHFAGAAHTLQEQRTA